MGCWIAWPLLQGAMSHSQGATPCSRRATSHSQGATSHSPGVVPQPSVPRLTARMPRLAARAAHLTFAHSWMSARHDSHAMHPPALHVQKILPPPQSSVLVRRGEWEAAQTVSELGIYGTLLRRGSGAGAELLLNKEVGGQKCELCARVDLQACLNDAKLRWT